MNIATIKDLKLDKNKLAPVEIKKRIAELIENEFVNQSTRYSIELKNKEDKLLDEYKKKTGFDKLIKQYGKIQREMDMKLISIKKQVAVLGLTITGDIIYYKENVLTNNENEEAIKKGKELRKKLNNLSMEQPNTLKNKILSRLWLCTTYGELAVILKEVMGNGIIPTLDKKELEYKEVMG